MDVSIRVCDVEFADHGRDERRVGWVRDRGENQAYLPGTGDTLITKEVLPR